MADNATIRQLLSEFHVASRPLKRNLAYYEGKARPQTIGVSVPPEMRDLATPLGWPRTYVNAISDRLDLESFVVSGNAEADDLLQGWWRSNNLDELAHLAHNEALIHGRSFIIVSAPDPENPLHDPNTPIIEVESPDRVWADIDPRTGEVERAIRVVKMNRSPYGNEVPDYITVYERNETTGYWNRGSEGFAEDFHNEHGLGVCQVIPVINRARVRDVDGHSEIFPELRNVCDAASRLMMHMAATAELMAIPQRILFGVDPKELGVNDPNNKAQVFDAYMARIIAFTDDGSAQQFMAAELRNFVDGLDRLTREAASVTGLPPQYFAYNSDNPASADAIRAAEARLVKLAERKQRMFGGAWEKAMLVALLVMKHGVGPREHRLEAVWRNAATPTFAARADAVTKLATAVTPEGRAILPVEAAREELGFSAEKRKQYEEWEKQGPSGVLARLYGPRTPQTRTPQDDAPGED